MDELKSIGMPFAFTCLGCKQSFNGIDSPPSECYPDFKGPAFKAYYCQKCATAINQERKGVEV